MYRLDRYTTRVLHSVFSSHFLPFRGWISDNNAHYARESRVRLLFTRRVYRIKDLQRLSCATAVIRLKLSRSSKVGFLARNLRFKTLSFLSAEFPNRSDFEYFLSITFPLPYVKAVAPFRHYSPRPSSSLTFSSIIARNERILLARVSCSASRNISNPSETVNRWKPCFPGRTLARPPCFAAARAG